MASAYGNTNLSLTGLVYHYLGQDSFLCGYAKILNDTIRDKEGMPPRHIRLSYKEGTHSYRTLVGFNFYPDEKKFESDLEWIVRIRDVNSQALRFEKVPLGPEEMLPEEKQFFTRVLIQLEKLSPAFLASPPPISSRMRTELRKATAGYPENFQRQFQERVPSGQAYVIPRFSLALSPESWGQSAPKKGRPHWWEKAPEFPAESSRVCTGRYG